MKRTFLLGVGAQKAGTSWLYSLLEQSEQFAPGFTKEYHIWDVRTVPVFRPLRRRLRDIRFGQRKHRRQDLRVWLMENLPTRYFSYFDRLLAADGKTLTADITPAYSALDVATLRRIRAGIVARGMTFRCVFIMRDPVKRCLSAFNMHRNQGTGEVMEGVRLGAERTEAFRDYVVSDDARLRTAYEQTLRALGEALPAEETMVLIYEELFRPETITRLEEFLGIPLDQDHLETQIFKTDYREAPDPEAVKLCFETYRPTYDAVAEQFPQVRELWYGLKKYT